MAQLNRNANYLFTIDGNTVWERLRNVRNFLNDRKNAEKVANLQIEKLERLEEMLKQPDIDIEKEYEIKESLVLKGELEENLVYCQDEVKFLTDLESTIAAEAEKTRIPGKTDKEMYEINYYDELATIHMIDAKTQLMTTGTITPDLMRTFMRNQYSLTKAIDCGILDPKLAEDTKILHGQINLINSGTKPKEIE